MTFVKKLTNFQIAQLVTDVSYGIPQKVLAQKYGVSRNTIWRIIHDKYDRSTREIKPCGTDAGYSRHIRKKELACAACCKAHAERERLRKRKLRGVQDVHD